LAFTYDITTNIGKVRRLIGDVDHDSALYRDNEIQFFLDEALDNLYYAAAEALESLANIEARKLSSYSRGGIAISRQTAVQLQQRAQQLREIGQTKYTEELTEIAWAPWSLQQILIDRALQGEV